MRVPTKHKILCKCKCDREYRVRVSDILSGKSLQCRVCSDKASGTKIKIPLEELLRRCEVATKRKEENRAANWGPYWDAYGVKVVQQIRSTASSARGRCTNKNERSYENYGGRGIECKFPTTEIMTKWILDNLGPKPSKDYSLDRVDNNKHYEPGNLRWATREEQARNKRQYKRTQQGELIKYILSQRGDVTYECVRNWIKQGLTQEQILNRISYARTSI